MGIWIWVGLGRFRFWSWDWWTGKTDTDTDISKTNDGRCRLTRVVAMESLFEEGIRGGVDSACFVVIIMVEILTNY